MSCMSDRHLHPTSSPYPFEMWRMDVIGPISASTSKGHWFILAITDYFSKWGEAICLKEVKTSDVIKFVKHHVLYCFGVPRRIVHDNRPSSLAKCYRGSVINSESKVCLQRHTIQLPMALQKLSIRSLANFLRSSSQEVNVTGMRSWVSVSGLTARQ